MTLFTVLGLLFFWLKRNGRDAGHLAVGCMGIPFWSTFMKHLLSRPRPVRVQHLVDVTSFSYPSGHTVAATSFYLLIAFLISRQFSSVRARAVILALALGLIAAIGFSRLYLGVHYPSDVLSGFLLGSAWVLFLTAFYSLRNPDSPTRL
ncbi:MAG: hypothetical protein A2992_08990 [Elusimicrobia bacterium RIFCSPLOWO2_01_FULL_59_12]|nr:MAG: hypothetical protein A2992_08990 [Elusimicrobia bacterium RIFCSPLOWO2_01_FULL_59_12]